MDDKDKSQYTRLVAELRSHDKTQQAIHIEWEALSDTFTALLSSVLNRKIKAQSIRDEYYYWNISVCDTPINRDELDILFALAEADELDREQNDFGEYPIMELCQGLCNKLMDDLLPYRIDHTRADDEGVWFIGGADKASVEQSLPDGKMLIAGLCGDSEYPGICISLRIPGQADEIICFAEHNSAKPEGKELCIAAYISSQDEPAYYESYAAHGEPSPNV
jgi:hypothetical protein